MVHDPAFHFDDSNAIWQINRERLLLLTGIRVLLMQVAHPLVAESVYQHSYVFQNPIRRLHRTLTLTLAMVFGTQAETKRAITEIETAHRQAVGRMDAPVGKYEAGKVYNPRNPRQALWVYATLVEGAVVGYEHLVAPLSDSAKQAFLEESALIADWMGIHRSYLPTSYPDLLTYMQSAVDTGEVAVSPHAREIAPFISAQSIPILNALAYPIYRFNVALLPAPIRSQYGFDLAAWEASLFTKSGKLSQALAPYMPHFLRFAPEYRRALALLSQSS